MLLGWLDHGGIGSTVQQRILTAIAAIPTDAAMRSLIERSDRKYVATALADAVKRFPVRANRLLTLHPPVPTRHRLWPPNCCAST